MCTDCLHQTTGVNCQTCKQYFYNPLNVSKLSDRACQKCNCNINGSRQELGYTFLDCLKASDSPTHKGMESGDCFCKPNVQGSKCDGCKSGFFNLTVTNSLGCEECRCLQKGTVNGGNSCTSDLGQCVCKNFTTGLKCEHCKDTYYNMTEHNPNGCDSCRCNLGGSKSAVCNKSTGICNCHTNTIIGQQCNELQNETYYPSLDFISDRELVRSNRLIMAWRGRLTIPRQNQNIVYLFAFQCTSSVTVDALINVENYSADQIRVENTCKKCNILSKTPVAIQQGEIHVDITFPSITNPELVQCTRLVGYPEEFYDPTVLSNRIEFDAHCDVLSNNISHPVCQNEFFTLTMNYLQKPLPCECSKIGSWNETCQPHLGQCHCKPGVTGRVCDQCMPGHYNLTQDGCAPCGCFGVDKTCHASTGQCNCEANTDGRRCDTCKPSFWNNTAGSGCQHCNCSFTGAMNGECNTLTGQCDCRAGVQGRGCDSCSPEFKYFSTEGCQSCNCSDDGSTSKICNPESGQCACKNRTEGLQCADCKQGSFFLEPAFAGDDGCLSCFCSGVSTNCTIASGMFQKHFSNLTLWQLTSHNRVFNNNTYIITRTNSTGSTYKMLSAPVISHTHPLFWRLESGFFGFDSVLAYSGSLSFFLEIQINGDRYERSGAQMVILKVSFFPL